MLHRGDDTNAFGAKFLEIDLENATGLNISKAEIKCGEIVKVYENPTFPILIYFNKKESATLRETNNVYLAIYDENGLKRTCDGCFTFSTKERVV